MDKEVEEVEEKTYSLTFDDGQFIFTDIATQKSGPVSADVAYSNSNQVDVDVSEEVLNILKLT
jgi:hypothetical protein